MSSTNILPGSNFSNYAVQIIFDNILNGKMPWPDVPGQMSYEAQDLINRYVLS